MVADRDNDAVTVVDLAQRMVIGELDLRPGLIDARQHGVAGGEYPYWVAIKGNETAYVSSMRDGEVDVVDITGPPAVTARIRVGGTPNRMVLDRAQASLFVASDNSDSVTVIDTATHQVREVIDAAAPPGLLARPTHFRGAAPNALALSADGRRLYVTLGGENAVAVIALDGKPPHRVLGLIPTGQYPNAVALGPDGGMLYVVNGRSDPPHGRPNGCSVNDRTRPPPTPAAAATTTSSSSAMPACWLCRRRRIRTCASSPIRWRRTMRSAGAPIRPIRLMAAAAPAHQARRLRDQGEPQLRSGARRSRPRQR